MRAASWRKSFDRYLHDVDRVADHPGGAALAYIGVRVSATDTRQWCATDQSRQSVGNFFVLRFNDADKLRGCPHILNWPLVRIYSLEVVDSILNVFSCCGQVP